MKTTLLFVFIAIIGIACQQRMDNTTRMATIDPASVRAANKLGIDDKSNQKTFFDFEGGYGGVVLKITPSTAFQEKGVDSSNGSFYIDATKVCNLHYRTFLEWNNRIYNAMPQVAQSLLPDTSIWVRQFPNETIGGLLKEHYFRLAAFDYYPVVGVSWQQVQAYALWRTDRINEVILVHKKYIRANYEGQQGQQHFSTYNYLNGLCRHDPGDKPMIDKVTGLERPVVATDDVLLPYYRLPTSSELQVVAKELKDYSKNKALRAFRKKVAAHTRKYPKPTFYDHAQFDLPHLIIEEQQAIAPYHIGDGLDEWTQQDESTNEQYIWSYHTPTDSSDRLNIYTPIWVSLIEKRTINDTIVDKFASQHRAIGVYKSFRCVLPNIWQ